jgi:Ca-activated chloride channel family protein
MRKIILLFIIHYSLFTILSAGLTDFKTIDAAHKAYEAKEYTKSAALYNSLEKKTAEKTYDGIKRQKVWTKRRVCIT